MGRQKETTHVRVLFSDNLYGATNVQPKQGTQPKCFPSEEGIDVDPPAAKTKNLTTRVDLTKKDVMTIGLLGETVPFQALAILPKEPPPG